MHVGLTVDDDSCSVFNDARCEGVAGFNVFLETADEAFKDFNECFTAA